MHSYTYEAQMGRTRLADTRPPLQRTGGVLFGADSCAETYEKEVGHTHTHIGVLNNSVADINLYHVPTYHPISRRHRRSARERVANVIRRGAMLARSAYWITMNPLTRRKALKVATRPLPLSTTTSREKVYRLVCNPARRVSSLADLRVFSVASYSDSVRRETSLEMLRDRTSRVRDISHEYRRDKHEARYALVRRAHSFPVLISC